MLGALLMWIQYKHNQEGRTRKFNISSEKPIPFKLETVPGDGIFCWELDESRPKEPKNALEAIEKPTKFSGSAVLVKDGITGHNRWATFNAEGNEHTNYPPLQPLVLPTTVALGTKIEIHFPES